MLLDFPRWLEAINTEPRRFRDESDAMRFVVSLSRKNIADGGGPFSAAVLDEHLNLVAAGVNRVVPAGLSMLHAEMVALMLAQQKLRTHDLASCGSYRLISSCEPCAMCLGAIPWSGVDRVVCGARAADAEAIGFDEGAKPARWMEELERRGITVVSDVLRDDAVSVLTQYENMQGRIY